MSSLAGYTQLNGLLSSSKSGSFRVRAFPTILRAVSLILIRGALRRRTFKAAAILTVILRIIISLLIQRFVVIGAGLFGVRIPFVKIRRRLVSVSWRLILLSLSMRKLCTIGTWKVVTKYCNRYWSINSVKVYTLESAPSSTSSLKTSSSSSKKLSSTSLSTTRQTSTSTSTKNTSASFSAKSSSSAKSQSSSKQFSTSSSVSSTKPGLKSSSTSTETPTPTAKSLNGIPHKSNSIQVTPSSSNDALQQDQFSFLACITSSDTPLTDSLNSPLMTVDMCLNACSFQLYAAIHNETCLCTDNLWDDIRESTCEFPCPGNETQICGGTLSTPNDLVSLAKRQDVLDWAFSVYVNEDNLPPVSSMESETGLLTSVAPASTGFWNGTIGHLYASALSTTSVVPASSVFGVGMAIGAPSSQVYITVLTSKSCSFCWRFSLKNCSYVLGPLYLRGKHPRRLHHHLDTRTLLLPPFRVHHRTADPYDYHHQNMPQLRP